MTKEQILKRIADLKEQKENATGTPCEVYSRVVGYLQPVQHWNKGKREEFALRKHFEKSCYEYRK